MERKYRQWLRRHYARGSIKPIEGSIYWKLYTSGDQSAIIEVGIIDVVQVRGYAHKTIIRKNGVPMRFFADEITFLPSPELEKILIDWITKDKLVGIVRPLCRFNFW